MEKILKSEKNSLSWKKLIAFRQNVVKSKLSLMAMLKKLKDQRKKIYGIGAPSRASTLVNYVGLTNEIINYICEIDGSYKIGNYMQGTNIPIVSEKILSTDKPDYLLLLSWHISKELIKNLKKKGYKGKFIIPLPNPRIV